MLEGWAFLWGGRHRLPNSLEYHARWASPTPQPFAQHSCRYRGACGVGFHKWRKADAHLESCAVSIRSSRGRCSVENAARCLQQWGPRIGAVRSLKAVQHMCGTRRRDRENRAISIRATGIGCAVEISVGRQDQTCRGIPAIGSAKNMKGCYRALGGHPIYVAIAGPAARLRSPIEITVGCLDQRRR